ncbi:hypothetical protein Hanom_Chr07g00650281 [Helianthus anomalus]
MTIVMLFTTNLETKNKYISLFFKIIIKSKMPFSSMRFGQFWDFHQRFVFPHLDPKGSKSCHFHPAR